MFFKLSNILEKSLAEICFISYYLLQIYKKFSFMCFENVNNKIDLIHTNGDYSQTILNDWIASLSWLTAEQRYNLQLAISFFKSTSTEGASEFFFYIQQYASTFNLRIAFYKLRKVNI